MTIHHVLIDQEFYVPAKHAVANRLDVAKALLLQFWGDCSDEKTEQLINDPNICVYVNDNNQGETLKEILNDLALIVKD